MAVERAIDRHPDGLTYAVPRDLEGVATGDRVRVGLGAGDAHAEGWVIDVASTCDLPPDRVKPILGRAASVPRLPSELLALARWIAEYYAAPIGVTLAAMVPAAVKRRVGARRRVFVDLPGPVTAPATSGGGTGVAVPAPAGDPEAGPPIAGDGTVIAAPAPPAGADRGPSIADAPPPARPGPTTGAAPARAAGDGSSPGVAAPPSAAADGPAPRLTPRQRAVLERLAARPPECRPVALEELMADAGIRTRGPIERLAAHGRITLERRDAVEARWRTVRVDDRVPARLSDEQETAIAAVARTLGRGFSRHLLQGVTGSGKTEVYLRLVERVVAAGRTALVLVPEIALTPQTTARLLGRFPNERVAILHSGLTAAQRHQQWTAAATGDASIVLGARSAVFAPIPDGRLGLIVVDEEHDGSFKQDRAPRYHGRDVAIRRAQLADCPVLLGSATPSMESWAAAARGDAALHRLTRRAPGMALPRVRVVDFAAERRLRPDRPNRLLGPTMERALREVLAGGGQAIVLLNRRGYASWIACPDLRCGWVMTCTECDVSVVYHRDRSLPAGGFVRCHHCGAEQRLPRACPDCGRKLVRFGLGTQRVEEELAAHLPELVPGDTLLRIDSDTMRHAGELHAALERFGDGRVKVLTGTQMIAKGLDFPNVRLVGVVNADTAIHLPDFRAAERTFQLVSQVAGRCGRAAGPAGAGTVIVQSFHPDTPAIRLAAAHDFDRFAAGELDDRRRAGLPPFARLVRIVLRDADPDAVAAAARRTAAGLEGIAAPGVDVGPPAPCSIARIAGRFRWDLVLTAAGPAPLQRTLAAARNAGIIRPGEAMAVDVDPAAML